jgi:hypothetical protein
MTEYNQRSWLFGLGVGIGVVVGIALARRLAGPRRMPFLAPMQRALAEKRGAVEAATLAQRLQARFDELYAGRPRLAHPVLRAHLEQVVLPGLALYQTLRAEGLSQEDALTEVERAFEVVFGRFIRKVGLMKDLPGSFTVFRLLTRWVNRLGFPSPGWDRDTVEDSERAIAFDYHRCFYLDVLTAYGAPELTPAFCKTDDWLAEALPPAIRWERTKTLGRGDDVCDFRWSLVAPE